LWTLPSQEGLGVGIPPQTTFPYQILSILKQIENQDFFIYLHLKLLSLIKTPK